MKQITILGALLLAFFALAVSASRYAVSATNRTASFVAGKPEIESFSAMTFSPDGLLFVGDSKGGTVFALDINDARPASPEKPGESPDIESRIAGLLGTTSDAILIHDMAVNPVSRNIYLAVSRSGGRQNWSHNFFLPNDLADASILLRVLPSGEIEEVELAEVEYSKADLPNPVAAERDHRWKKGIPMRVDTITDLAYHDGKVFIAGLSNEEFASTMWQVDFPFVEGVKATTIEIYHGAHGKYETQAPIRTFLPYEMGEDLQLLAAYLCTPLVTLNVSDLKDGEHYKGRTVAEFGSGNYPLDMLLYQKEGKDRILIANSNLPLMIVDPEDVKNYEGSITEEVESYLAGVPNEYRAGLGVQQVDIFNADYFVALQRMPGGQLDLLAYPVRRF